jgi:GT2 family glycosyltransferase
LIYTFIPYSLEKNLGQAYNNCMKLISDKDWAVFLDYDVMFTIRDWQYHLDNVIKKYGDVGLYTCFTNRAGTKVQTAPGVDRNIHDLLYHMEFGRKLRKKYGDRISDLKLEEKKRVRLSGFFMLISKKTWNRIGGSQRKGLSKVDWEIAQKIVDSKLKVFRIDGLYAYHYRRGLKEGGYG